MTSAASTGPPTVATAADRPYPLIGPPIGAVREVEVDGCLTIYRRDLDRVLVLNTTASDIWRLCDGSLDESEIVGLLARAYAATPDTILEEVRATITTFVEQGFVDLGLR